MNGRPPESLKELASDFIEKTRSGNTTDVSHDGILEHFHFSEMEQPGSPMTAAGEIMDDQTIGIWKWTAKGPHPCYERDLSKQKEWVSWAKVHRIYPKKTKKRVLLLGESVARGYFYSPHYTVAKELQAILDKTTPMPEVEITDLAKIGMTGSYLQTVLKSAMTLQPDAVVIFAGNNLLFEMKRSLTEEEQSEMLRIAQTDSPDGLQSYLTDKMKKWVADFLKGITDILSARNIPLVFVIPEFNLLDWRSNEFEQMLQWLPGNNNTKWLTVRKIASTGLFEKDMVETLAQDLTRLNPFNPLGHELLADCHMLSQRWDLARQSLETARDTALTNLNDTRPRILGVIRQTILSEAVKYNIRVVDLPTVFKDHLAGKIPDRTWFLDYCHLTVRGIQLAMRHTAQTLIPLLTGEPIKPEEIAPSGLMPDRKVESVAHFCAAVHNAHYGQATRTINYHCTQALSLSPPIKEVMLLYMDFATRSSNTIICRSFADLIASGITEQYEGVKGFLPPPGKKMMDISLVDALLDVLVSNATDARPRIEKLRKTEHSVGKNEKDLLLSFYSLNAYDQFREQYPSANFRSRTFRNEFHFVCDTLSPLTFRIVIRTPGRQYEREKVTLFINNTAKPLIRLPVSRTWNTHFFDITREQLQDGMNRLIIEWPVTQEPLQIKKTNPAFALTTALYPVLGEISALLVKRKNDTL